MRCTICHIDKPTDAFRGTFKKCRSCQAAYLRQWRKDHPEATYAHKTLYRLKHLDQVRAYNRAYSKSHRRISVPR